MKKKIENRLDERKFEVILLITLTIVLITSLSIGHYFNKGTYPDGPNVNTNEEETEGEENNQ